MVVDVDRLIDAYYDGCGTGSVGTDDGHRKMMCRALRELARQMDAMTSYPASAAMIAAAAAAADPAPEPDIPALRRECDEAANATMASVKHMGQVMGMAFDALDKARRQR